jgi:hypothetical protein
VYRRFLIALVATGGLAACGADQPPADPSPAPGARPAAYGLRGLTRATASGRPVAGLRCAAAARPTAWVHIEIFDHGRVVLLPSGIGIAPPRRTTGAYVRGGRCRYPLWTDEPTGLVAVTRSGLRLGDLFRVWGRALDDNRVAAFRGAVTAHVDGTKATTPPQDIPLTPHAQIVLQVGGPLVTPHAAYRFPPNR